MSDPSRSRTAVDPEQGPTEKPVRGKRMAAPGTRTSEEKSTRRPAAGKADTTKVLAVPKGRTGAARVLLGSALPAHILTPSVTSRGVVNMTALAAVEAQETARPG